MADILISKFTTQIPRVGATPATPGFAESEGQDPVAPSGTPQVYTPVTIGSPANGLSMSGTQVLTIGLASTSTTGALSSTDWNTFNGKLNLTSPITGYTVGANTALADTDTILQAFGKVQGQINARISGSGVSERLAIFNGTNSVTSFVNINYVNSANRLDIRDNSSNVQIALRGTASGGILAGGTGGASTLFHRPGGDGVGTNQIIHNLTGFGIGNITPTNTLDVNGTARIRTISNLGSAATSVLVPSATGVVSLRTLAELSADGLGSKWTDVAGGIFRNGAVAVGRTTIPSTATFAVQSLTSTAANEFVQFLNNSGTSIMSILQTGRVVINSPTYIGASVPVTASTMFALKGTSGSDGNNLLLCYNSSNVATVGIANGGLTFFTTKRFDIGANNGTLYSGLRLNDMGFKIVDGSNNDIIEINSSGNIVLRTTTGTQIGTATNQRLAFYGSTPIVKPSGDILTALSNLGLITSPTITQVDQFAVKTTASADQTLPSGTLTILDYDTTLLNNSTATYTVGTTGRITINTTGIYTITAGVVIEADAVTALESAFLGIFRNGDLVAISSINTTIAAGAQSGLSTSTILSLTATDIIDCRALVNSVGGVANGLARRLGTLLGANATQVNSLSITKNSM